MKEIKRRDKMKIYYDILSAIQYQSKKGDAKPTRLQLKLNVPYDRFKQYLEDLWKLGLIEDEESPKLTEKGKKYIREYDKVLDFMKRIGIAYK